MKNEPTIAGLTDRTPRYTVKEIAEKMNLTTYAVRYYDNAGLIPYVERTSGNIRLFSDYNLAWLKIVHCLRSTGLPVTEVRAAKGIRPFPNARLSSSHRRKNSKSNWTNCIAKWKSLNTRNITTRNFWPASPKTDAIRPIFRSRMFLPIKANKQLVKQGD